MTAMVKATLRSGARRRSKKASRLSPRATMAAIASVMRVQIDMRSSLAGPAAAHKAVGVGAVLRPLRAAC